MHANQGISSKTYLLRRSSKQLNQPDVRHELVANDEDLLCLLQLVAGVLAVGACFVVPLPFTPACA